jgi:hypothetical protein
MSNEDLRDHAHRLFRETEKSTGTLQAAYEIVFEVRATNAAAAANPINMKLRAMTSALVPLRSESDGK